MTYEEKMRIEHPTVDNNFRIFSCPGNYFENAPHCDHQSCPGVGSVKCSECWGTEVNEPKSDETTQSTKLDAKKIADRAWGLYSSFQAELWSDEKAWDLTKIIVSAEVQHELSKM